MSEACANGKLKRYQPSSNGGGGAWRERKIPGVISHNNALYFVEASGWTYTERWRPSKVDEAERLRRAGHGVAVETMAGSADVDVAGNGCVRWVGEKGGDGNGDTTSGSSGSSSSVVDGQREGREELRGVGKARGRKKSLGDRVKSFVFGAAVVTQE